MFRFGRLAFGTLTNPWLSQQRVVAKCITNIPVARYCFDSYHDYEPEERGSRKKSYHYKKKMEEKKERVKMKNYLKKAMRKETQREQKERHSSKKRSRQLRFVIREEEEREKEGLKPLLLRKEKEDDMAWVPGTPARSLRDKEEKRIFEEMEKKGYGDYFY